MNKGPVKTVNIPLRGGPPPGFTWQANELYDVFQPIIDGNALLAYVALTRKAYPGKGFSYSTREIANIISRSPATVFRALATLEYIGMVRLNRGRGSRRSECELTDLRELARQLGAAQTRSGVSKPLSEDIAEQLRTEIKALRRKVSGKPDASPKLVMGVPRSASNGGGNLFLSVSQRNAGVLSAIRQCCTGETQTGFHLLLQNTRLQNIPSPHPPAQDEEAQRAKDFPDENGPDGLLRWAQIKFTGVMDDMRAHVLDTSRPPNPSFTNGAADWEEFGLNSWAVEAAEWRGKTLMLVLCASDPTAARRGLDKYREKWKASLCKWYGCDVDVELQPAQRKW